MYTCFLERLISPERDCLKDLSGNKKIILKRILKKRDGRAWIGFIWISRGTSDQLFK